MPATYGIYGNPTEGDELREWLYGQGAGIFSQFDTGVEALQFLRSIDSHISTGDFYNIRRDVINRNTPDARLEGLDSNELIPASWHDDTHGWNISTNFLYKVRVEGVDPMTGDWTEKYLSVGSNAQMTPAEVLDQLNSMVAGEEESYEVIPQFYYLEKPFVMPGVFQ